MSMFEEEVQSCEHDTTAEAISRAVRWIVVCMALVLYFYFVHASEVQEVREYRKACEGATNPAACIEKLQ